MEQVSQIITINEARKLLGKITSDMLTDVEVTDMIEQLDFIARLFTEAQTK